MFNFPIKAIIIDDDPAAIELLKEGLEKDSEVEFCGSSRSLEDGKNLIKDVHPDLIFLDIEFPEENGLELMRAAVPSGASRVVFYTSYKKYLIQALRLSAFDFLLKPYDEEELRLILHRFKIEKENLAGQIPPSVLPLDISSTPRNISITTVTNDKMIVAPSGILFFKYDSDRKLWEAVLTDLRRVILKRHTTADTILNYGQDFIRTHKAYIINIKYLGVISGNECRMLPPFNGITEVKISKNYRREVLEKFYDL